MISSHLTDWFNGTPIVVLGAEAAGLMLVALAAGIGLRRWSDHRPGARERPAGEGLEGVFVSAALGMLALLLGFTFSIALNRFETRRNLVLEEANAIGTTFLRAQLLDAPHRARIGGLLTAYADNRLALGKATTLARARPLRAENDRLINELWAATSAASSSIQAKGLTTAFLSSMNQLIDIEAARRVARSVQVPTEVFIVLFAYLVVTGVMLGYVSVGRRERVSVSVMLLLLILSLMLILDVDRPIRGGIQEDQAPMEQLLASLKTQTPEVFDHYLIEDARAAQAGAARP